jgi:hypothetical protein
MKKFKLFLFSAVIGSLFFTSCNELGTDNLEGSDLTNGGSAPVIVGWASSTVTESYFSDLGTLDNTYAVAVLSTTDGSPTTGNIDLNVSVDASTTATDGGEYSIPSTSVSIPAGSSFGNVPININTGSFNPTSPTKLVVNITASVNGVVVSESSKQMTINFVGCLSTLDVGTYNVTITRRNTGGVVSRTNEAFTKTSVNNFQTPTVGAWPLSPGLRFEDICGSLYVSSHDLADTYSNQVTGAAGSNNLAGTVDASGNFTLSYNITGASSVSGPWGIYDAVYTKN